MLGVAVHDPLIGAGAVEARFGGGDSAWGIRVEGFGDDFFADVRAVGIGSVDEINSESDGAAKNFYRFGTIFVLAPNSLAGDAHGSVAEAVDRKIAADFEGAGFCGGSFLAGGFCRCGAHRSASI